MEIISCNVEVLIPGPNQTFDNLCYEILKAFKKNKHMDSIIRKTQKGVMMHESLGNEGALPNGDQYYVEDRLGIVYLCKNINREGFANKDTYLAVKTSPMKFRINCAYDDRCEHSCSAITYAIFKKDIDYHKSIEENIKSVNNFSNIL